MARVVLNEVRKTYPNGFQAVHGIDLDVADGEFVALVGPSGCGKSSLLRMIAGLETVTEGEIHIGERLVNRLEPAERDIAMVFQNYALYPHMSVYDNMAYGLRNRRTPRAEIEQRVQEAAKILELEGLLDRRPRQLSGGQRQRVAMGRAIVRKPEVFLFDEPLSNLDAKLRVQMRLEIKRLQASLATTSIYVTHDQVEAMTMANRLVVMNQGRAEQIGTPMEVYASPATAFVAGFIGSPAMNFLEGQAEGGRITVNGASGPVVRADLPDGPVLVGLRPEHLVVSGGDAAMLELVVEAIEPLGADTLIHGRTGHGKLVTARRSGAANLGEGDRIKLSVENAHLHLFNPESGARIG